MIKHGQSKSDSLSSAPSSLLSLSFAFRPLGCPSFSHLASSANISLQIPFFSLFFLSLSLRITTLRMRESNFAFPAQNRAAVCISSQLYDRRGAPFRALFHSEGSIE